LHLLTLAERDRRIGGIAPRHRCTRTSRKKLTQLKKGETRLRRCLIVIGNGDDRKLVMIQEVKSWMKPSEMAYVNRWHLLRVALDAASSNLNIRLLPTRLFTPPDSYLSQSSLSERLGGMIMFESQTSTSLTAFSISKPTPFRQLLVSIYSIEIMSNPRRLSLSSHSVISHPKLMHPNARKCHEATNDQRRIPPTRGRDRSNEPSSTSTCWHVAV
jgi:hypothetical protein